MPGGIFGTPDSQVVYIFSDRTFWTEHESV